MSPHFADCIFKRGKLLKKLLKYLTVQLTPYHAKLKHLGLKTYIERESKNANRETK